MYYEHVCSQTDSILYKPISYFSSLLASIHDYHPLACYLTLPPSFCVLLPSVAAAQSLSVGAVSVWKLVQTLAC